MYFSRSFWSALSFLWNDDVVVPVYARQVDGEHFGQRRRFFTGNYVLRDRLDRGRLSIQAYHSSLGLPKTSGNRSDWSRCGNFGGLGDEDAVLIFENSRMGEDAKSSGRNRCASLQDRRPPSAFLAINFF